MSTERENNLVKMLDSAVSKHQEYVAQKAVFWGMGNSVRQPSYENPLSKNYGTKHDQLLELLRLTRKAINTSKLEPNDDILNLEVLGWEHIWGHTPPTEVTSRREAVLTKVRTNATLDEPEPLTDLERTIYNTAAIDTDLS